MSETRSVAEIHPCQPGVIPLDAPRARWQGLGVDAESRERVLDARSERDADSYQFNIENYIGTVKVPVGLAGPLRVRGQHAVGDFYAPLATTEAVLVASYNRGASVIRQSGCCVARVLDERIGRTPAFAFRTIDEALAFAGWIDAETALLKRLVRGTTRFGELLAIDAWIEGNHVYLHLDFSTGEAAGQNMVTFAADAIVEHVRQRSPVAPRQCFVEGNCSGDKKASARAFQHTRGKRVAAEVVVPRAVVEQTLNTSVETMLDYWRMAALGGVLSGTIGVQGQYANGLAALYLACGQDVACVAESAVGVTRVEAAEGGALYASVTLPAVIVATVGGGTTLPSQSTCMGILDLPRENSARAFAEICGALVLAGELSLIGALSAGEFARAHRRARAGQQHGNADTTRWTNGGPQS